MAEVLASSITPLINKTAGNDEFQTGKTNVETKEENDSSNVMIKTYPFLTITVYIPTACVGVLIGKRGSHIDSIQKLAAKESTKFQSSSRGTRNKSKPNNKGHSSNGSLSTVAPDSVRISVVNYPPPPSNTQQSFDQHFKNLQGTESGNTSTPSPQQQIGGTSAGMMDMGVPPTYTELDFSDPQWTPIVIRADPIAAIYAANAIHDICCPEYVVDRNQLVYIIDIPVPAVAATNNANLRHASIVGKRGNKLIQLSADHKCRIMVPPKQLGHDVIQLEAPLKECCSCLKAITGKLQSGGSDEKEPLGDATKTSPSSPNSKNAKNNATKGNNPSNKNKNENSNGKSSFQTTIVIQPLPSQTKLRNIARKTETKILKKRTPKPQQRNSNGQKSPAKQRPDPESKQQQQAEQSLEGGEMGDEPQEKSEEGTNINNNNNNSNSNSNSNSNNNTNESKVSWRLTVIASTEKKVLKAVDMLKVLNSKGYEVILEELGVTNNSVDTSSKTVTDLGGGAESDADNVVADDAPRPTPATNGHHGGRGGGRGGRHKKQRHRNNHRGNNGKDNNNNSVKVPTATTPTATAGDS
eukprot:CAMPEP_0116091586 /NCGR_PEP_ID=MMETSP0327-20121206/7585_1 /TAXON_ID=44447 /ORGANISM="Pseudo-nitzschia delicatissima, Strain B596" /LENGTH=580 /DNA_ID=CAMNT_0003582949 /DNA_START=116 /DNA_END=1858 /DNA_ORIENTATION=+